MVSGFRSTRWLASVLWPGLRNRRYENGDRERLVDSSYKLTLWIHEFGGVTEDTIQQYERIIERFRRTGELILPVG